MAENMSTGVNRKLLNLVEKNLLDLLKSQYIVREEPFFNENEMEQIIDFVKIFLASNTITERQEAAENAIRTLWDINPGSSFYRLFINLKRLESVAVNIDERYRDHLMHSLYVFLLGLYLYNKLKPIYNKFSNNEIFLMEWMFTSLLHDFGYPVESYGKNLSKYFGDDPDLLIGITLDLGKYITEDGSDLDLFDKIDNYIREKGIWPEMSIKSYFNRDCCKGKINHGIFSAIAILYAFDQARPKEITEYKASDLFMEQVSAICLHDVNLKKPFSLDVHPFAFLLILCDELQEWHRFSVGREFLSDYHVDFEFVSQEGNTIFTCKYAAPKEWCREKESLIKSKLNTVDSGFEIRIESFLQVG